MLTSYLQSNHPSSRPAHLLISLTTQPLETETQFQTWKSLHGLIRLTQKALAVCNHFFRRICFNSSRNVATSLHECNYPPTLYHNK
jgi:hypothetical protein